MPLTNDALTTAEIDYLQWATLSPKIVDDGAVTPLGRNDIPTHNYLMRKAKKAGDPVQGGYRFNVKGLRDQKMTFWDGADILAFESHYNLTAMNFFVGKAHMGDQLLYDVIERTGIRVDYTRGIREGTHSRATLERVVNIIKENADDIKYRWDLELAKHIMKSNVAVPKAFSGLDALLPATTNTAGQIGGRSRADRNFRHQLITGSTADTLLADVFKMVRRCHRFSGGSRLDYLPCGDNVYDKLVDIFTSPTGTGITGTVAGKMDYKVARDAAMAKGEKYNISLPQDCFSYEDMLIANDPIFELLDAEEPSASWGKRMFFLNTKHIGVIPVMTNVVVPHSMPDNLRLQNTSYHGEYTVWCNMPNSQGVLTIA